MEHPVLPGRLAEQTLARLDRRGSRVSRQRGPCDQAQPSGGLLHVHRPDLRIDAGGEKGQHRVSQHVQALLALELDADGGLRRADPALGFAVAEITRRHPRCEADEGQEDRRTEPGDPDRQVARRLPFRLAERQALALLGLHVGNGGADPVHRHPAAIGEHDRAGLVGLALTTQRDRVGQLGHLLRRELPDRLEAGALGGALGHAALYILQVVRELRPGAVIGIEIALLAGDEIAALAGLRVEQRSHHALELLDRRERLHHAAGGPLTDEQGPIREEGDQRHREGGDQEADEGGCRQQSNRPPHLSLTGREGRRSHTAVYLRMGDRGGIREPGPGDSGSGIRGIGRFKVQGSRSN